MKTTQKRILPRKLKLSQQRSKDLSKFETFLVDFLTKQVLDENALADKKNELLFEINYESEDDECLDTAKIQVYTTIQKLPDILIDSDQNATMDKKALLREYSIPLSKQAYQTLYFDTVDNDLLDLGLLLEYDFDDCCVAYPYKLGRYLIEYSLASRKDGQALNNPEDNKMIEWLMEKTENLQTPIELRSFFSEKIPASDFTFKALHDWFDLSIDEQSLDAITEIYIDPTTKHSSISYIKPDDTEENKWKIKFDGHDAIETFHSEKIDGKDLICLPVVIIPKTFARQIADLIRLHTKYLEIDMYAISCRLMYNDTLWDCGNSIFEMYAFDYNERVSIIEELLKFDDVNRLILDHLLNIGKCLTTITLPQDIEELDIAYFLDIFLLDPNT
jgi:hypothetical protein